jgi:hypothetical protein
VEGEALTLAWGHSAMHQLELGFPVSSVSRFPGFRISGFLEISNRCSMSQMSKFFDENFLKSLEIPEIKLISVSKKKAYPEHKNLAFPRALLGFIGKI